jgi:hypothetical protein
MAASRVTKILEARTLSLHIQRFIDRIRGNEARGSRDFVMPMTDAKGLHADLTDLLLELNTLRQQAHAARQDEVIQVSISGGGFK